MATVTTMAQRLEVVEAGLPKMDEAKVALDQVTDPSKTLWYDLAEDYFVYGDEEVQQAVITRLPDSITWNRRAYVNANSSSLAIRLFETILSAGNQDAVRAASEFAGLYAIRTELAQQKDSRIFELGGTGIQIQCWFYRANPPRAISAVNRLLGSDDRETSRRAEKSIRYWLSQPRTDIDA